MLRSEMRKMENLVLHIVQMQPRITLHGLNTVLWEIDSLMWRKTGKPVSPATHYVKGRYGMVNPLLPNTLRRLRRRAKMESSADGKVTG